MRHETLLIEVRLVGRDQRVKRVPSVAVLLGPVCLLVLGWSPSFGAAVFGPEHSALASPGEADWVFADLSYTDGLGYTVNTAR